MERSELFACHWSTGLADVLLACPTATAADELALLRKGYGAIREAAALNPSVLPGLPTPPRFEALLACRAAESAALALIPARAGVMLSRSSDGRHIGSVFLPETGEHTVEGATAAIAIMAALLAACHALLDLRPRPGELLN